MPNLPARRLHRHPLSGHCHRVELFLSILGLKAELVDVDLAGGAHKAPAYLAMNPLGQVPVLEDDGLVLADSSAILVYLAARHDATGRWHPRDPLVAARVQRWLSLAAGPLVQGPALARVARVFGRDVDTARAIDAAHGLLRILDAHLEAQPFLASDTATIADLAFYAYTAHAPEGDVSLAAYPHVRGWLARVEALPGFVPMQRSPVRV